MCAESAASDAGQPTSFAAPSPAPPIGGDNEDEVKASKSSKSGAMTRSRSPRRNVICAFASASAVGQLNGLASLSSAPPGGGDDGDEMLAQGRFLFSIKYSANYFVELGEKLQGLGYAMETCEQRGVRFFGANGKPLTLEGLFNSSGQDLRDLFPFQARLAEEAERLEASALSEQWAGVPAPAPASPSDDFDENDMAQAIALSMQCATAHA